jgi:hypothetical protein
MRSVLAMTHLNFRATYVATMCKVTVALLLCLVPSVALGAATPKGLVVVFDGNDRETRREIYDVIVRDMRVDPPDDFNVALANEAVAAPLGDALANPRSRKAAIAAVRSAMRTVDAPAVISVRTKKKGALRDVHIVAILSTQGGPLFEEDLEPSPGERVSLQLSKLIAASFPEFVRPRPAAPEASTPATPATSARAKHAVEEDADKEESPSPRERPKLTLRNAASPPERDQVAERETSTPSNRADPSNATWIFNLGLEWARRDLEYNQPWVGNMRSHLAPGMAVYSVGGELYPGATMGTPVLKDLALVARFADSLPFETVASNGQTARGGFRRYAAGMRGRIRTGDKKDSPLIGVEGTYGMWQMAFTGADQVVDEAPSVAYGHVRAGVDARLPFGPFALLGGAGYMMVSSAGKYEERFPRASVGGVDAMLGGTWSVMPPFELKLLVTYARFFSSANSERGDRYIAGGALDQYVIASLGVSTVFR